MSQEVIAAAHLVKSSGAALALDQRRVLGVAPALDGRLQPRLRRAELVLQGCLLDVQRLRQRLCLLSTL